MFSINELKEDIQYIVVSSSHGMDIGATRKIKDDVMYQFNGSIYEKTGFTSSSVYKLWKFTLKYPTSIKEAAEQLDAHCEGWANRINLIKWKQSDGTKCILGQLFGDYFDALDKLYNITDNYQKYGDDNIFGEKASIEEWKKEINSRKTKEKVVKTLTFGEACQALADGKRVRIPAFGYDYLYIKDGQLTNSHGRPATNIFTWRSHNDWSVVITTFKDIANGKKFKTKLGVTYTKVNTGNNDCRAIDKNFNLGQFSPDEEVEAL